MSKRPIVVDQSFVAYRSGKIIARADTLGKLMAKRQVKHHLSRKQRVTIGHQTPEGMIVAYRGAVQA